MTRRIPQILSFLAERGVTNIHRDEYLLAYVEWIAPRELVFVRGVVRDTGDDGEGGYRTSAQGSRLELSATPDHPVFIALQPLGARSATS